MDSRFMKRVRATQQSELAGRTSSSQSLAIQTSLPIPHNLIGTMSSTASSLPSSVNTQGHLHLHLQHQSPNNNNNNNNISTTTDTRRSSTGIAGGAMRRRDTVTKARTTGPPGSARTTRSRSANSKTGSNNQTMTTTTASKTTTIATRTTTSRRTRLFEKQPARSTRTTTAKGSRVSTRNRKTKLSTTANETITSSSPLFSTTTTSMPTTTTTAATTTAASVSIPPSTANVTLETSIPSVIPPYDLRGSTRKNTSEVRNNNQGVHTDLNQQNTAAGSSLSGGNNNQANIDNQTASSSTNSNSSNNKNNNNNTNNNNNISNNINNNNINNNNINNNINNNNMYSSMGSNNSGISAKDSKNVPQSSMITTAPCTPQAKRTRTLQFGTFDIPSSPMDLSSPTMMRSPGLKSPTKKRVYDRFIPVRETDLSEQYSLLPDMPSTPSRNRMQNFSTTTPSQTSNMADGSTKRVQDQTHGAIMANELNLMPHMQSPNENRMLTSPQRFLTSPQRRLFNYSSTTTYNTMHFDSPSRQIYSSTPVSFESRKILLSPKKATRTVGNAPFKVLDAPELKDDFYLNLVDWSSQNVLGVGLGSCVYLWHALNGKVTQLCDLGNNDSVASLSWISMGTHLAVGTNSGAVQIWDVATSCRIRSMSGHRQRVGVLAWSGHTLTSGSRDRNIFHRDVRAQSMWTHKLEAHTGEVCGLKWNMSGTQLASGGNDNRLMVWERGSTKPLYKFRDHTAAVKAIDWNPHASGVLASGGGTVDRHIRFWNTNTGQSIGATDTGSQVCNLVWSKTTNELVSTHGFSQNQVFVWKYPSMEQIAVLKGHSCRVLYLSLSPDGQTIVTGAGDETLRFWNVFQKSKVERRDDDDLDVIAGVPTIR
ncbi:substrate-specific activator of APC-dependent proteolysis [Podila epigama]|nr:substrate-specific activator of APC-dependent proteolysis [Podila epigama]